MPGKKSTLLLEFTYNASQGFLHPKQLYFSFSKPFSTSLMVKVKQAVFAAIPLRHLFVNYLRYDWLTLTYQCNSCLSRVGC